MTDRPSPYCPAETVRLVELASRLHLARQRVRAHRMAPVVQADLRAARDSLLRAMEAYAAELMLLRMPIPPRLRDELRLLRQLPP